MKQIFRKSMTSEFAFKLLVKTLNSVGLLSLLRRAYSNPTFAHFLSALAAFLFSGVTNYRGLVASEMKTTNEQHLAELFRLARKPIDQCIEQRVLLAVPTLCPGGAERQVVNTAIGLLQQGKYDVHVVAQRIEAGHPDRQDFYRSLLEENGLTPLSLSEYFINEIRSSEEYRDLLHLRKEIGGSLFDDAVGYFYLFRKLKPETVHAFLDWANISAGLGALMANIPNIIISGRNVSPPNFSLPHTQMKVVYNFLLGFDNVKITNNSLAGAFSYALWLNLPINRIRILRNGIRIADGNLPKGKERDNLRQRIGLPKDIRVVGGLFRLMAEKRPLLWCEVADRVVRQQPDVYFVLIGDGALKKQVFQYAKKTGLRSRLLVLDPISPVSNAFAIIDLLLLTSRHEGTPNVLIEAQWYGVPTVAVNVGGVAETLRSVTSGIVVNSDNPKEIADQVVSALDNLEYFNTNNDDTRDWILENFGQSKMITKTIELYEGINNIEPRQC